MTALATLVFACVVSQPGPAPQPAPVPADPAPTAAAEPTAHAAPDAASNAPPDAKAARVAPNASSALGAARSVLLAPISAAAGAHQQLGQSIVRALARSLARLTSLSVLTARDVEVRLGELAAQQLTGCDDDSCAADVANALGVDLILQGRLDQAGGLWLLQVGVLQRATAEVVFRRQLRSRSADGLLNSLDPLVREMFGGGGFFVDDPSLAGRLGTNSTGVARLREGMGPKDEATAAWTRTVIEANKESELLAFAEGALLALSGAFLLATAPLAGTVSLVSTFTQVREYPVYLNPNQTNTTGPYVLNYAFIATQLMFLGIGVAMVIPALAALVLGILDWMDIGRIPVEREGCCRDEEALRKASAPGWGRRLAPYLAAAGGVASLLYTLANVVVVLLVLAFFVPLLQSGPSVPGISLDLRTWTAVYFAAVTLGLLSQVLLVALGSASFLGALLLIHSEYNSVVDQ